MHLAVFIYLLIIGLEPLKLSPLGRRDSMDGWMHGNTPCWKIGFWNGQCSVRLKPWLVLCDAKLIIQGKVRGSKNAALSIGIDYVDNKTRSQEFKTCCHSLLISTVVEDKPRTILTKIQMLSVGVTIKTCCAILNTIRILGLLYTHFYTLCDLVATLKE